MFILIKPDEDGNHMTTFETEGELAEWLDEMYGPDTLSEVVFMNPEFLLGNPDPNYWPNQGEWVDTVVLIKGDVVVPRAVEVVKRWEV